MKPDRSHFDSLHLEDSAAASCHTTQERCNIHRTRHLDHMKRHRSQSHIVRLLEGQSSLLRQLVDLGFERPHIYRRCQHAFVMESRRPLTCCWEDMLDREGSLDLE